ncbi:MAG: hypothetical protein KIT09_29635 [Bryobacteraceae bacterium]|nr:hypothetical protein [Bryobacteraceae bacterium]
MLLLALALASAAAAQSLVPDWRRIGNSAIDASLPSLATGPVERVWFSPDGGRLYARTESGAAFVSQNRETWQPVADVTPPVAQEAAWTGREGPEPEAKVVAGRSGLAYALGRAVYRSEDGGGSWANLTEFKGTSILGGGFRDIAVSPADEDEIVVAGRYGVWRSSDGGLSWSGLNDTLPNLPGRRLAQLPADGQSARLLAAEAGELEWAPGEKSAWRPVAAYDSQREEALKRAVAAVLRAEILSVALSGDFLYAGGAEGGRIWASADRGVTWRSFTAPEAGPIRDIFVAAANPRVALAATGRSGGGVRVLRTMNGGIFWDDLTSDLPEGAVHAVTADYGSGAVYVAADAGVFLTLTNLASAGPASGWMPLTPGLTARAAFDVRLDEAGNQLYIVVDGEGVYAATAPHRFFDPKVVSAADLRPRAAAPGALLSVLGRDVRRAQAGSASAPVLAGSERESQIQVPFEVSGSSLTLALETAGRAGQLEGLQFGLPLREAAPAIFVDREGAPMALDADSGVLLDAMRPARSGSRIQILATGLGRVQPEWPAGLEAPLDDPPRVVAPVRLYLDRRPIEVTRATLAPGYIGFYLIEAQLPRIVNAGPAELYLEAGGEQSNRTRIYLEP